MRVAVPQAGAGVGSPALQLSAAAAAAAAVGPPTAPEDVLHTINLVTQILAMSFTTVFMALRLLAKTMMAPPLHAEDCRFGFRPPLWRLFADLCSPRRARNSRVGT